MRHRPTRLTALLAAACIVFGACSGSAERADEGTVPAASEPATSTTVAPGREDTDGNDPAPAQTTSTTAAATTTTTTTTTVPPRVVPIGVRWTAGDELVESGVFGAAQNLIVVDDELWLMGNRYNGPAVFRSRDAGITWEPVEVASPPSQGTISVHDLARGHDGRLVVAGSRGSRCQVAEDVGDGYRVTGICKRFRPTLFLSDDDGASWREVEPAAMAPPGDVSVALASVVATADGFLAAGTVRGPDWHGRLWSSPDGESWSLDDEIRGVSRFASVEQLLTDGDSLVLLVSEHPCAAPTTTRPAGSSGRRG